MSNTRNCPVTFSFRTPKPSGNDLMPSFVNAMGYCCLGRSHIESSFLLVLRSEHFSFQYVDLFTKQKILVLRELVLTASVMNR